MARVAHVDAVSVAAGGRRVDAEARGHDPGAAAQVHVEAPAVHERQAPQRRVRHVLQNQGLQHNGRRPDHLAISSTDGRKRIKSVPVRFTVVLDLALPFR